MTKTPDRQDKGMDRQRGQNPVQNPGQNPNDPKNRDRKPMGGQDEEYPGEHGERGRKGGTER